MMKWRRKWSQARDRIDVAWGLVRRFGWWMLGGGLVVAIGVLLFSPMLQIREIRVSRSDPRVDIEQVQRALAPLFGERLLFVANADILPLITKAMPDLKDAEISKSYPSTLALTLHPTDIVAQLTIDETGTGSTADGLKDYLTEDGMYVRYAPQQVQTDSGLLLLRLVDWGAKPVPWTPMLAPDFVETMRKTEDILASEFNLKTTQRAVYLRAREFHLQVGALSLWFDMRSSTEEQIERYRLYLKTAEKTPAKSYVDLRLRDKIVYK